MENKEGKKLDTSFMEYLGENPSPKARERYDELQGRKSNAEKGRAVLRVTACIVAGGFLWRFGPSLFDSLQLSLKVAGCFASVVIILNSFSRVINDEDKQM